MNLLPPRTNGEPPEPKPVTISAAERAARSAGFTVCYVRGIRDSAKFSDFLRQVGAGKLGLAKVVFSVSQLEKFLKFTESEMRREKDREHRTRLMDLHLRALIAHSRSGELLLKVSAKNGHPQLVETPELPPGNPSFPIQVNIQSTQHAHAHSHPAPNPNPDSLIDHGSNGILAPSIGQPP